MSEDWKPGDMALCINPDGWFERATRQRLPGPVMGQVHQVEAVWIHCFPENQYETLVFGPWPNDSFDAKQFRKITPGTEINGSEVEREKFKQGNPWKVPA